MKHQKKYEINIIFRFINVIQKYGVNRENLEIMDKEQNKHLYGM